MEHTLAASQPAESADTLAPVPPSDEALLIRVQQRDETALGTLYDRYHRLLFTIALRITADRSAAEEVLQDVFQVVWQAGHSYKMGGLVSVWLVSIARHRAIDVTRRRNFHAGSGDVSLADTHLGGRSDATEEQVLVRIEGEIVRHALAELPIVQRQVIELVYYGGLSRSAIAAQLGQPVGTVKSRIRLGLLKLHEVLKDCHE
jgi:RNA polymerase sigma-70 factor (ECF subfamily)